ncbi:MAG: hypothetical protein G8345_22290, partial [Magnetococcales bacterium]|nr:hypothetical protein [Magnetococcales bacterium]
MGVIKKIFYRGTILDKPSFRNFFLDMEENIHIHYRDLRIELSRGEFEDICSIFRKQSSELQAIIDEKNYQDGKLANANQEDVRIWTESRLNYELKYHPQRLSIEACSDGYHLHFRNIKLLMNDNEFRQLVKIFSEIDVDSPVAENYEEVLSLIELNDVDFVLDSGNVPGQLLALAVAKYHLPKVRDIFGQIGFTSDPQPGAVHYNGASLKVVVREDKGKTPMDYKRLRGLEKTERLIPYLTRKGEAIDPNELNNIKCQVLDMLAAMEKEQPTFVMADLYSWLYSP